MIDWIPRHIKNAEPGDGDLLTEIQGIENLRRPLFDEVITYFMELGVVHWLQVGSHSFFAGQMNDHHLVTLVHHRSGRNLRKTFYHGG